MRGDRENKIFVRGVARDSEAWCIKTRLDPPGYTWKWNLPDCLGFSAAWAFRQWRGIESDRGSLGRNTIYWLWLSLQLSLQWQLFWKCLMKEDFLESSLFIVLSFKPKRIGNWFLWHQYTDLHGSRVGVRSDRSWDLAHIQGGLGIPLWIDIWKVSYWGEYMSLGTTKGKATLGRSLEKECVSL